MDATAQPALGRSTSYEEWLRSKQRALRKARRWAFYPDMVPREVSMEEDVAE